MPRPVKRAVTAAVEYGVARTGIAAVRALDRDVIGQAHHPRGAAGHVAADPAGTVQPPFPLRRSG